MKQGEAHLVESTTATGPSSRRRSTRAPLRPARGATGHTLGRRFGRIWGYAVGAVDSGTNGVRLQPPKLGYTGRCRRPRALLSSRLQLLPRDVWGAPRRFSPSTPAPQGGLRTASSGRQTARGEPLVPAAQTRPQPDPGAASPRLGR